MYQLDTLFDRALRLTSGFMPQSQLKIVQDRQQVNDQVLKCGSLALLNIPFHSASEVVEIRHSPHQLVLRRLHCLFKMR